MHRARLLATLLYNILYTIQFVPAFFQVGWTLAVTGFQFWEARATSFPHPNDGLFIFVLNSPDLCTLPICGSQRIEYMIIYVTFLKSGVSQIIQNNWRLVVTPMVKWGSPHLKKLVGAFLGPGGLNSTCPFCVGRLVPQVKPVVKY